MKNKLIKIGSIIAVVIVLVTMTVVPTFAASSDSPLGRRTFNESIYGVPVDVDLSDESQDTLDDWFEFAGILISPYSYESPLGVITIYGFTPALEYEGDLSMIVEASLGDAEPTIFLSTDLSDIYGGTFDILSVPSDDVGQWVLDNSVAADAPAPDVPNSYFTFYFAAELNTGDSAQIVGADGVVKTINGGKGSGDAIYSITDNPLSPNYVKPRVSSDGERYIIVSLQLDNYGFNGTAKRYYSLDSFLNGQPIETVSLQSSSYDVNCEPEQYWRVYGGSGNGNASVSIDLYIWLGNVVPDPDDSQYQLGYENGYHNGHIDGFTNGYSSGYDEGYMLGYAEGSNQDNFIVSIFTDPIGALMGITLYEHDGFELTIGSIFFTIIGILLLVVFLRYFAGG